MRAFREPAFLLCSSATSAWPACASRACYGARIACLTRARCFVCMPGTLPPASNLATARKPLQGHSGHLSAGRGGRNLLLLMLRLSRRARVLFSAGSAEEAVPLVARPVAAPDRANGACAWRLKVPQGRAWLHQHLDSEKRLVRVRNSINQRACEKTFALARPLGSVQPGTWSDTILRPETVHDEY